MSKRIGVAVVSIIFLVALVSAVPVDAKKGFSVYRWDSTIYWSWEPVEQIEWTGVIETEDGEVGTIYWDNHGAILLGPDPQNFVMQKFWGEWWIDFGDDDIVDIRGTHKGIFNPAISQSVINGHIIQTSTDWSDLDGRRIHTIGYAGFDVLLLLPYIEYYLQIN
jgi:hypothetical protein